MRSPIFIKRYQLRRQVRDFLPMKFVECDGQGKSRYFIKAQAMNPASYLKKMVGSFRLNFRCFFQTNQFKSVSEGYFCRISKTDPESLCRRLRCGKYLTIVIETVKSGADIENVTGNDHRLAVTNRVGYLLWEKGKRFYKV